MTRTPRLARQAACAAIAWALCMTLAAHAGGPSMQLTVGGAVTAPTVYDLDGLQALPPITQTDTFVAGTDSQTHTFTGASLWGVLSSAGIVTTAAKNDVLNRYVLATGTDGYKVVFSLGELDPNFGNRADLVAYADAPAPIGSAGFARTTAAGDVKGGRYVSNLVDLDVRNSGSGRVSVGGGSSTQFSVNGDVMRPMSFDLAALEALTSTPMPKLTPITETVGGISYTGVSFWDLLNTIVGITTDPSVKNDVLGKFVVATGSDGYRALFSMGELDPAFGKQPDIVAFKANGEPLADNGFARIVVPNDLKAGRFVSNLANLEVFSAAAVPEPRTYELVAAGLLLLGALRLRRGVNRR